MLSKTHFVFVNNLNIVHFGPYGLVQTSPACACIKYVLSNVWRDFRLPVSAFATRARKVLMGNLLQKNVILIGHFMLPLLTLTLEVSP